MYRMRNIVSFDCEVALPNCMYSLKKITEPVIPDELEIDIRNQVIKFLKQAPAMRMNELEERQDLLLKKLDILYDRIKTISSNCNLNSNKIAYTTVQNNLTLAAGTTEEIVIVLSPDSIPWFLNIYLKQLKDISVSWHIHSSVPSEKKAKIYTFFKKFSQLYPVQRKVNIRLIFKSVAADAELKISSLEIPIVGTVNIMRYLALTYPSIASYDFNDHQMDSLLDLCVLLERSPEKNKEALIKKIFLLHKNWIQGDQFSIVDLAVYNIVKQWQNSTKYVPKTWFENCEKLII